MRQALCSLIVLLALCSPGASQPASAQPPARLQSPWDISGYWVALVTEDWRYRMQVAEAGDHEGIAMTAAGTALAAAWDPGRDLANGDGCKAYGVGGIMRMPTRLNITWTSDNVLSIATDAGRQTRVLKFGPAQDLIGIGNLQGVSHAHWVLSPQSADAATSAGSLAVRTTGMAPGYLRRNGVPYSADAVLDEYFELVTGADGTEYLVVISILEDPLYLARPVVTSSSFRREANGARWAPADCSPD